MSSETTPFEPGKHLIQISGRDYLEVKWRLVWLRTAHPEAVIETEMIRDDGETALFRSRVSLPNGATATGWGSESVQDFGDYVEKAETKSLGRALAALGYGTQFCQDFDYGTAESGRVVDAPVLRSVGRRPGTADLATERQVKAIYAIGRAGHLSETDVMQRSQDHFGCTPEQLGRREASQLIDLLKQEMAGGLAQTSA